MAIVAQVLGRRNTVKISLNILRTIMTTPTVREKVEQAAEELKTNPYYEKYAQKIATLQQTSPEDFLSRIETRQIEKGKPKFGSATSRQYSSLLEPKKKLSSSVELQDEPLSKVMKVELVQDKDTSEISTIWSDYHKQKDVIAATIPAKCFDNIMEKAKKYPTFLFPIPRSQGYEFIVHKENAPECLTITHYTEFKDSKGIVLMRGEFDKNIINGQEAQCLANQLQLYYSQDNPEKVRLLEQFTKRPDEFKHMELIKQVETFV